MAGRGRGRWLCCRVNVQTSVAVFVMCQLLVAMLLLYGGGLPSGAPNTDCDCEGQRQRRDEEDKRGEIIRSSSSTSTSTPSSRPPAVPPPHLRPLHSADQPSWGRHRLAVVVPFRDRMEEMLDFVPHMHAFLNAQRVRHKIFIVNQVDNMRFNRASLINVGFLQAEEECDYFAMHDVDLLPLNPALSYAFPQHGPFHVAAPELHPMYHYATFVGGILLLTNVHMRQINGLSNKYWGWGKEDDEFYVRMKEANLTITRPVNITTGYDTFQHIHEKRTRPRDNKRYYDQKKKSRQRDRVTGLTSTRYVLDSARDLSIEGAPVTILNVRLHCDLNVTPWCITPGQLEEITVYLKRKKVADEAVQDTGQLAQNSSPKPVPLPSVDLSDIVLLKDMTMHL